MADLCQLSHERVTHVTEELDVLVIRGYTELRWTHHIRNMTGDEPAFAVHSIPASDSGDAEDMIWLQCKG